MNGCRLKAKVPKVRRSPECHRGICPRLMSRVDRYSLQYKRHACHLCVVFEVGPKARVPGNCRGTSAIAAGKQYHVISSYFISNLHCTVWISSSSYADASIFMGHRLSTLSVCVWLEASGLKSGRVICGYLFCKKSLASAWHLNFVGPEFCKAWKGLSDQILLRQGHKLPQSQASASGGLRQTFFTPPLRTDFFRPVACRRRFCPA